jgi:hypothetical protein
MTTIDDELERVGRQAAFIKVDVEGQDLAALQGAIRALRGGSVRLVTFEHLPTDPLTPLLDFFESLGWKVFALDDRGCPTTEPRLVKRNMNLFAAPEATLAELQLSNSVG